MREGGVEWMAVRRRSLSVIGQNTKAEDAGERELDPNGSRLGK